MYNLYCQVEAQLLSFMEMPGAKQTTKTEDTRLSTTVNFKKNARRFPAQIIIPVQVCAC